MSGLLLVAVSSMLGGLSGGASIGFAGVLLQQLNANDSSIHLDLATTSWIGSLHSLTGLPSIIIPIFAQWRGRKQGFIVVCLACILGWILASTATSSTTILISESVIGFGYHSLITIVLISISEMLSPQYRNMAMVAFFVIDCLSLALVEIAGKYLHWRTVSLLPSLPMIVALFLACLWPESPSWLAYKGRYKKCEKVFAQLRGTGDEVQAELEELILAQKENATADKWDKLTPLQYFWSKLKRRDFYLPAVHIFVLLAMGSWSGNMVIIVYSSRIIRDTTQSKDAVFFGTIAINSAIFTCFIVHIILMRYISQKRVFLASALSTIVCLLGAAAANYCQTTGLISRQSHICFYFLIGCMIALSLGVLPLVYSMSNEVMPVKHRDLGGPLTLIFSCILETSSLKLAPYLFMYIHLWGTLLLYVINAVCCGLFVWRYVPETKGQTLQQLEDYYAYRKFEVPRQIHTEHCLNESNNRAK